MNQEEWEAKISCWKEMPRDTAANIKTADGYYESSLLPLIADKFIKKYEYAAGKYKNMFMTLGTSWQPIAMSILLQKPCNVVILTTEDVKNEVESIKGFVKQPDINYHIEIVDKGCSKKLLETVARYMGSFAEKGSCCFDITGGTKAMAAAAAMAAVKFDFDIFYIESDFNALLRKPEPGSEKMVKLFKPQDLFVPETENFTG